MAKPVDVHIARLVKKGDALERHDPKPNAYGGREVVAVVTLDTADDLIVIVKNEKKGIVKKTKPADLAALLGEDADADDWQLTVS